MCLPQLHCRRPRRLSAITGNEADGLRSATTAQSTIVSAVKQPSGRQRPRAGQAHSVGGGRAGTGDLLRNSVSRGKERRKDGDDNWSIHFNHENATWAKDSARGVCRVKGIRFVDDPCGRCGRSLPPSLPPSFPRPPSLLPSFARVSQTGEGRQAAVRQAGRQTGKRTLVIFGTELNCLPIFLMPSLSSCLL